MNEGLTPYQVAGIRKWLGKRGFPLENLQEKTVQHALAKLDLPADVKRVLQIRQTLASLSLTKLNALRACTGVRRPRPRSL